MPYFLGTHVSWSAGPSSIMWYCLKCKISVRKVGLNLPPTYLAALQLYASHIPKHYSSNCYVVMGIINFLLPYCSIVSF